MSPTPRVLLPTDSGFEAVKAELRQKHRAELLAEIDAALRSDGAAMHHNSCWRNMGFGAPLDVADARSAEFMADFIQQRFKP